MKIWSGRSGSNRRHSAWEADVLPLNYARAVLLIAPGAGAVQAVFGIACDDPIRPLFGDNELARMPVIQRKRAGEDVEMGAVQRQASRFDGSRDAGIAAQIAQTRRHRGLFQQGGVIGLPARGLWQLGLRVFDAGDPAPGVILRRERRGTPGKGRDPAAPGMAEHDDMPHGQLQHRIFEGRRDAGITHRRIAARHEVGDVAADEEFTGNGIEDGFRRYPRIATADHHGLRLLRTRLRGESHAMRPARLLAIGAIALHQTLRQHGISAGS